MPQKSDKLQKPLFLMSPPGSQEAADIGYINIPKIVKEPPLELSEVQEFTDNTGFLNSIQETHFWVYRPFVESKKESFDLITPLFPNFLKYAVPWIVCEYALYCVETDDRLSLRQFVDNTIKKRLPDEIKEQISDHDIFTILYEKRWREKERPINWIKTVVKNIKIRKDRSGLFHNKKLLSIDAPVITGNLFDDREPDTILESLYRDPKYQPDHRIINSLLNIPEDELLTKVLIDKTRMACKDEGLSDTATNLFITYLESSSSILGAKEGLKLSKLEYETARKAIQRKKISLQKRISEILKD